MTALVKAMIRVAKSSRGEQVLRLAGLDTKAHAIRTGVETAASFGASYAMRKGQESYEAKHGKVLDTGASAVVRSAITGGLFFTPGTVSLATPAKSAMFWAGAMGAYEAGKAKMQKPAPAREPRGSAAYTDSLGRYYPNGNGRRSAT